MPFVDFLLAVEAILNLRVRFGKGDDPIASATDPLVGVHDGTNHLVLFGEVHRFSKERIEKLSFGEFFHASIIPYEG